MSQLDELELEANELQAQMKDLSDRMRENEKLRKSFMKDEPLCHCCYRHVRAKNVWKATQEDADNWFDQNEGYCGPTVGEYYCGC